MRLAIVMVTWNSSRTLPGVLDALGEQVAPGDEIIVVDNASGDGSAALAAAHAAVTRVVRIEANLGFATGCNRGAAAASPGVEGVVFLNPDCTPEPGCLDALRSPPTDWVAWMALVCLEDGGLINSAGNEVHFLGFGWAGRIGEPVTVVSGEPTPVGFLSGACLAIRRAVFDDLGGFAEPFFMYVEDLDLSLRLRLAGHEFGLVPNARVRHAYTFEKGTQKWRLLERNRWLCVLRCYPAPVLVAVLPAMLALEPVLTVVAFASGWGPAKLNAVGGVVRALPRTLRERREVQRTVRIDAPTFAAALRPEPDSPYFGVVGRSPVVRALLRRYWGVARRLVR